MSVAESKLLQAVALALVQQPRANLQQLAEAAGVSRATLYRCAPTREKLVEQISQHAIDLTARAMDQADLTGGEPVTALEIITQAFFDNSEVFTFLFADTAANHSRGSKALSEVPPEWRFYTQGMEDFFQRGQQAGTFCSDLPAVWLARAYDGVVRAAIDSRTRGEIAPAHMMRYVLQQFMKGAAPTAA